MTANDPNLLIFLILSLAFGRLPKQGGTWKEQGGVRASKFPATH
jgi:hypothetical protein